MSTSPQLNKTSADLRTIEIHEETEALEGYVVDPRRYPDNAAGLKTSADGFVLIPQPLDTDDDPLNWSPKRKWRIVAVIAYIAALADYTGGTAIITVIPQSMYVDPVFMHRSWWLSSEVTDGRDITASGIWGRPLCNVQLSAISSPSERAVSSSSLSPVSSVACLSRSSSRASWSVPVSGLRPLPVLTPTLLPALLTDYFAAWAKEEP